MDWSPKGQGRYGRLKLSLSILHALLRKARMCCASSLVRLSGFWSQPDWGMITGDVSSVAHIFFPMFSAIQENNVASWTAQRLHNSYNHCHCARPRHLGWCSSVMLALARQNVHAPDPTGPWPDSQVLQNRGSQMFWWRFKSLSVLDLHRLVLKGQGVTESSNINLHVSAGLAGSLGCPGCWALKRGDSCWVAGH